MKNWSSSIIAFVLAVFIFTFLSPVTITYASLQNTADTKSTLENFSLSGNSLQSTPVWKIVLFVYSNIDVTYLDGNGIEQHFVYTITESEKMKAIWSFRQFASNAQRLSDNQALILYDVIYINRTINTLTQLSQGYYWVSPDDVRAELDYYAPNGAYDSVFIYWPQNDLASNVQIPSWGWGLALTSPSGWSNGATYASVANAPEWMWESPSGDLGEVWLHEWLHGVCGFYANRGYVMPNGDADGGGSHQYQNSPTEGWSAYYHDLMTGNVLDNGVLTGITAAAWQTGSIIGNSYSAYIDHYFSNPINNYSRIGTITWQSTPQNIFLGALPNSTDNLFYKDVPVDTTVIITGRVQIPSYNVGPYDSVALAFKGDIDEYWATLAYGTLLSEKGNISIMKNGNWGGLSKINLQSGWYTIKILVDQDNHTIKMKAWGDKENEPEWQLSRTIDPIWSITQVGFRHYGLGISVDDFYVLGESPSIIKYGVFIPLILRLGN